MPGWHCQLFIKSANFASKIGNFYPKYQFLIKSAKNLLDVKPIHLVKEDFPTFLKLVDHHTFEALEETDFRQLTIVKLFGPNVIFFRKSIAILLSKL